MLRMIMKMRILKKMRMIMKMRMMKKIMKIKKKRMLRMIMKMRMMKKKIVLCFISSSSSSSSSFSLPSCKLQQCLVFYWKYKTRNHRSKKVHCRMLKCLNVEHWRILPICLRIVCSLIAKSFRKIMKSLRSKKYLIKVKSILRPTNAFWHVDRRFLRPCFNMK